MANKRAVVGRVISALYPYRRSKTRDHGTRTVNPKNLIKSHGYTIIENYIIMSASTSASVLM